MVRYTLRLGVSLVLLALLTRVLDSGSVVGRFRELDVRFVLLALGLSVLQVLGSAWRWAYTARRLDVPLPPGAALGEYYLATFLNQLLPGGVAGDVTRAWRHARRDRAGDDPGLRRRAVSAVILERASGQAVMILVAAVSAAILLHGRVSWGVWLWAAGLLLVMVALTPRLLRRWLRSPMGVGFRADAREALLRPPALAVHALTSLGVVASYVGVYLLSAAALGVDTPLTILAPLVAPVLMTMLLPVSVAGWGLREGAAAALWGAVGLTPAEGVAISVAYGLLVLLSSLPGALVLGISLWRRDPGRRGDRSPA